MKEHAVNTTSAESITPADDIESSTRIGSILRAAVILAALYVAFAIGTPWLLYDAPPSAEDVLVSCKTAQPLAARAASQFDEATVRCRR